MKESQVYIQKSIKIRRLQIINEEITGGKHMILFLLGLTTGLVISTVTLIALALATTKGRKDDDDD